MHNYGLYKNFITQILRINYLNNKNFAQPLSELETFIDIIYSIEFKILYYNMPKC